MTEVVQEYLLAMLCSKLETARTIPRGLTPFPMDQDITISSTCASIVICHTQLSELPDLEKTVMKTWTASRVPVMLHVDDAHALGAPSHAPLFSKTTFFNKTSGCQKPLAGSRLPNPSKMRASVHRTTFQPPFRFFFSPRLLQIACTILAIYIDYSHADAHRR